MQGVSEGDQSAVGVSERYCVRAGEVEDGGNVVGLLLDGVRAVVAGETARGRPWPLTVTPIFVPSVEVTWAWRG